MAASANTAHDDNDIASPTSDSDSSYPELILERIAFGSCHSRDQLDKRLSKAENITAVPTIWDTIASTVQPQTFLWTGDAIYRPKDKRFVGDTPLTIMQEEYYQIRHNKTLGYAPFLRREDILEGGVHGTWDDHDYGGNDRGRELKGREERRDAFLEFLDVPRDSARWERKGVYSSVEFGGEDLPIENGSTNNLLHGNGRRNNKVKIIFLDTRWHRSKYCIPSVGSNPYVPYGALVACLTRWITAAFDLPSILPSWTLCSADNELLGEEQWMWLEQQLKESTASMHVVISSIQVLTTNPVVESWGHFPLERQRLLKVLNNVPGLVLLSGDVHHAEILSTDWRSNQLIGETEEYETHNDLKSANKGSIVEVTSSGFTHACGEPFYGPLCKPILNAFPKHRYKGGDARDASAPSYFTSRNFGSISIDWLSRSFLVHVHNDAGEIVLTTGRFEMDSVADMSDEDLIAVPECIDGHFWPFMRKTAPFCTLCFIAFWFLYLRAKASQPMKNNSSKSKQA